MRSRDMSASRKKEPPVRALFQDKIHKPILSHGSQDDLPLVPFPLSEQSARTSPSIIAFASNHVAGAILPRKLSRAFRDTSGQSVRMSIYLPMPVSSFTNAKAV